MDLETKIIPIPATQRTLHERPLSITCRECGRTAVRIGYPGRPPLYCDDLCVHAAKSRTAAVRMRRLRQRRAAAQDSADAQNHQV